MHVSGAGPVNLQPEFYEGVGRVVVAAAGLDFMLATMVRLMSPSGEDLWAIASRPGFALKQLDKIGKQMPPRGGMYDEVRAIAADAQRVLNQRHRIAHSLHLVTETSAGLREAVTVHPKTEKTKGKQRDADDDAAFAPLPTKNELAELTSQIIRVGARAGEWLVRYAGVPHPNRASGPRPPL
jgi:hypothetical protein